MEILLSFGIMPKNAYNTMLRELILQLFHQKDEWHGYDIVKTLKAKSDGEIDIKENRLYPALHKLEEEGILESKLVKVDNRSRKYYTLTEQGANEVVSASEKLAEIANTLQLVLNPNSYA